MLLIDNEILNTNESSFILTSDQNNSQSTTIIDLFYNYSATFSVLILNHLINFLANFYLFFFVRLKNPNFIKNLIFSFSYSLEIESFKTLFSNSSTNIASSIQIATNPLRKVFDLDFELKILIILLFCLSLLLASIAISWKIYSIFIINFKLSKGKKFLFVFEFSFYLLFSTEDLQENVFPEETFR